MSLRGLCHLMGGAGMGSPFFGYRSEARVATLQPERRSSEAFGLNQLGQARSPSLAEACLLRPLVSGPELLAAARLMPSAWPRAINEVTYPQPELSRWPFPQNAAQARRTNFESLPWSACAELNERPSRPMPRPASGPS
ncbi:hypothetical protein Ssi02_01750 [Sinosporangium siamense]|uniref:Uncharacterized protein n=1 Tax=Sinosporangium siamense TaxID=1367973 RepID=A0A919V9A4_9ACTN|nr:hypothetical protein Ssi02_01750 [Sinosporangium siamense]